MRLGLNIGGGAYDAADGRFRLGLDFRLRAAPPTLNKYEMRRYAAVTRHLILTMTSVLFLMRETARLRKKRLVEPAPSPCIHGVAA